MSKPIIQIAASRAEIDHIDSKIIELLGQRFEAAKKIGEAKKELGTAITDTNREQEIKQLRLANCRAHKVDPEFANELFAIIIRESKKMQE